MSENLAYLAGFLDGEGTFTVYQAKSARVYSALVSAASNDHEQILWLQKTFGGNVYAPNPGDNREQGYQWQIRDKELLIPLLQELSPLLRIKQLQARLLLKYCLKYRDYPRGRELSAEDIELRNAYCNMFSLLNATGKESANKKLTVVSLFATGEVGLP